MRWAIAPAAPPRPRLARAPSTPSIAASVAVVVAVAASAAGRKRCRRRRCCRGRRCPPPTEGQRSGGPSRPQCRLGRIDRAWSRSHLCEILNYKSKVKKYIKK